MKKVIGIIAGDPNSINSEIIAKAWFKKNNFKKLNIFIIGSLFLLEKQISKIGYNIRLKKIDKFSNHNFKKNFVLIGSAHNLREIRIKERQKSIEKTVDKLESTQGVMISKLNDHDQTLKDHSRILSKLTKEE